MADIELKTLLGRLNEFSTNCLQAAAEMCVNRGNYEVSVEHLMFSMMQETSSDIPQILHHYGIDGGRVNKGVTMAIERMKTGNTGRPVFSKILTSLFQDGWLIASINHGLGEVRSGNLFEAVLSNPLGLTSGEWADMLETINKEDLKRSFAQITVSSSESARAASLAAPVGGSAGPKGVAPAGDGALAKYCTNFTQLGRDGKIDPIFGRDREIRQMIDVLGRRRKNNPIAVGDAGVGKTALIEGLALRIAKGDVPIQLRDNDLLGLDLGLLQAGAGVKGEFEKRLSQVIDEIKGSPTPIILFIDEAHTLIGAGGQQGGGDAANLLKPALARGELRTVAATTWAEYKKYFEKDPALTRRFQLIKVDEPTDADTVTMLRGLKPKYEEAHKVTIRDDALEACAELGSRYIAGRQHPDKGVDLMDTAGARVKIQLTGKPAAVDDLERQLDVLERQLAGQQRDVDHGATDRAEIIKGIEERIADVTAKHAELEALWQKQKEAADKAIALREALGEARAAAKAGDAEAKTKAEALRQEADAAKAELESLAGEEGLMVPIEVGADEVANVISDMTGIPMNNMVKDEAATLLEFEQRMIERVKGQDRSMKAIGVGIRAAKAGLTDPVQPMGVFLLVGPSGVGKTECALGVADLMFGGEQFMTTINMSEFQDKSSVSRLIGSAPGLVGYGEGGVLTEAVRQRPYSVVLLDEVEKADLKVMELFYQVFDKGVLNDAEGREVKFRDTVIFLTSNLATDLITEAGLDNPDMELDELVALIRPALSAHFKPALLARMNVLPFFPLTQDSLRMISQLKLKKLQRRLRDRHKINMEIDEKVYASMAARCTEVETGARNVDHIIRTLILPRVSTELLSQMSTGELPDTLKMTVDDNDEYQFAFEGGNTHHTIAGQGHRGTRSFDPNLI